MEDLLNSSIPLILVFQSLGTWLLVPMKMFSFLGTEDFYILALPIIYWCIDAALGLRIGVMMLLSSGVNTIFKFIFHAPRPYWVNADVQALASETSFGAPSGHAQNAVAVWGTVGSYFRKGWVWAVSIFIILGISLSRLYLAVHFPFDTFMGWLIGIILLARVNRAWQPLTAWAKSQSMAKQLLTSFSGSLLLILAGVLVAAALKSWTMPVAWQQNAVRAGGQLPDPLSISGLITSSATLFGLLAGVIWLRPQGGYQVSGSLIQRILRYLVGILGLAVFYVGLKLIFPEGANLLAYAFRYLRYGLVGFWVSGGAPYAFLKLKLTN